MFGGLSICSLSAVVGRDGREVIIEVSDSAMGLVGEGQEEDRRDIATLTLDTMHTHLVENRTREVGAGDEEKQKNGELPKRRRDSAGKFEMTSLRESKAQNPRTPLI